MKLSPFSSSIRFQFNSKNVIEQFSKKFEECHISLRKLNGGPFLGNLQFVFSKESDVLFKGTRCNYMTDFQVINKQCHV